VVETKPVRNPAIDPQPYIVLEDEADISIMEMLRQADKGEKDARPKGPNKEELAKKLILETLFNQGVPVQDEVQELARKQGVSCVAALASFVMHDAYKAAGIKRSAYERAQKKLGTAVQSLQLRPREWWMILTPEGEALLEKVQPKPKPTSPLAFADDDEEDEKVRAEARQRQADLCASLGIKPKRTAVEEALERSRQREEAANRQQQRQEAVDLVEVDGAWQKPT
jgi:hypothetical protein